MAIYIKYKKKIEEETTSDSTAAVAAVDAQKDAQLQDLNTQIVGKLEQKRTVQTEYENKTRVLDQQINQLKQKIAQLGGNVKTDESFKGFGKKIYEAITNKTDEMFALISLVFNSMEDISYKPDNTRCRTFAKNIVAYLNRGEFKSETADRDLTDFLMKLLNNSQISLSNKEKDTFIKKLIENMKESTLFSWIFIDEK
ncbi:MAG: hypothetical protein KIH03_10475 [Paludibacteraceae bacterium]|nr:hypothetical protein [Paludibacteraceae bacterium]